MRNVMRVAWLGAVMLGCQGETEPQGLDLDQLYADAETIDPEEPSSGKTDETGGTRGHFERIRTGAVQVAHQGAIGTTLGQSDPRVGGTPFAFRRSSVEVIQCRTVPGIGNIGPCNTNDPAIFAVAQALGNCGLGDKDVLAFRDHILSFYAPDLVRVGRTCSACSSRPLEA